MASTIQIKRGTGSAVPTGLADGELAINLDNGKLYFGSGSTSVNDFTFGEITAEKYIVSSSVLYVTTSFSSGSTEFGNSADDTHTFTGNITASGNISSSGEIEANTFKASGNVDFNGDLDVDGTTNLDTVDIDGTTNFGGTVSLGANGSGVSQYFYSDTAGKFAYWSDGYNLFSFSDHTYLSFGTITGPGRGDMNFYYNGSRLVLEDFIGDNILHISSSDTAQLIVDGHITASGNMLLTSTNGNEPVLRIEQYDNTASDAGPSIEIYRHGDSANSLGGVGPDGLDVGSIKFIADDFYRLSSPGQVIYSEIQSLMRENNYGVESGILDFKIQPDTPNYQYPLTTAMRILDESGVGSPTVEISGSLKISGSINSDVQLDGTLTVGVDGTGYDVKLFGDTSGRYLEWDQSADQLEVRGTTTFGAAGSNYGDVEFFGQTYGRYAKWEPDHNRLYFSDNAKITFGTPDTDGAFDSSIYADGSNLIITNTAGNIQIGDTVEVTGQLHVSASGESKFDLIDTGGQAYRLFVRNSDDVFGIYDVTQTRTWFRYTGNATVGNTKLSLLEGGGKVGIGNTSPPEVLTVEGNISSSGDIQYSGDLNGKQRQVYFNNFEDKIGTSKVYIPLITTFEQSSRYVEEVSFLAPCSGRVASITVRPHILSNSSDATVTVGIETLALNLSSLSTTYTSEESKTHTMAGADDYHAFHYQFDNAKHFDPGDLVALFIDSDIAPDSGPYTMYWYVTTVIEYDWNNQGFTAHQEYDSAP